MLWYVTGLGDVRDPLYHFNPVLSTQRIDGVPIDSFLLVPSIAQYVKSPLQQAVRTLRLNNGPSRLQNACKGQEKRMRKKFRESSLLKVVDNLLGIETRFIGGQKRL